MKRKGFTVLVALSMAFLAHCSTTQVPVTSQIPASDFHSATPREADVLWKQAEQDQKTGNLNSAVVKFEKIAQTYPRNTIAASALDRLGQISLAQNNAVQSLKYYDYLLYMYPQWRDINVAKVGRLEALRLKGERRDVVKDGLALWQSAGADPKVQFPLSLLLARTYSDLKEVSNAFDWASLAASKAQTQEEKNAVAQIAADITRNLDEGSVQRLLARNPSDFMKVFLEFRLAQIARERGRKDEAHQQLVQLLSRSGTHPLAPEIRKALGEAPIAASSKIPVNLDKIGCLVPMNGPYERYGKMVLHGVGLAADEWNQAHPNQPVNVVAKDTPNQPEAAVKTFEQMGKDYGILAAVGPISKQATEALSPVVNQWGIPLLSLTQIEDSAPNPYILHVFLDNEKMVRTLVRYCREKLGYKNFAALYPSDRYGKRLEQIFGKVVKELGGNLVASVPYEPKGANLKEPIQKLVDTSKSAAADPRTTPFDALFIPDESQMVSLIAPQLPYYNIVGVTLLGTNLWGEPPMLNEMGGVYVENAIFVTPFYADSAAPAVQSFNEKFRKLYETAPSYLEAQAYDAMRLLLQARSKLSSSPDQRGAFLQKILQTQGFEGVTGTLSFTPSGEMERKYQLLQIQKNQISPISQ